jgi:hypothetical protein
MWQICEGKVIVLTRGDLARVADKKDGKTSNSDKLCRDVQLNRKESAEVIVLLRKCTERRCMDWRLYATKPKGGYIRKLAVLNDLPDVHEIIRKGRTVAARTDK